MWWVRSIGRRFAAAGVNSTDATPLKPVADGMENKTTGLGQSNSQLG